MRPFTGVKDTDREILSRIESEKELLSTCLLNKYFLSLCDGHFYRNRLIKKYSNLVNFYANNESVDWKKIYLENMYYIGKMQEDYNFIFSDMSTALPKDYYTILKSYKLNMGMKIAAKNRLFDLADYFIEKGATNTLGALLLSIQDKEDISTTLYFMERVPINAKSSMLAFQTAAKVGNKPVMDLFIEMMDKRMLSIALYDLVSHRNYEMADYLISEGADIPAAILYAEQRGNIDVANFLRNLL